MKGGDLHNKRNPYSNDRRDHTIHPPKNPRYRHPLFPESGYAGEDDHVDDSSEAHWEGPEEEGLGGVAQHPGEYYWVEYVPEAIF